jgi:hypothetical protein
MLYQSSAEDIYHILYEYYFSGDQLTKYVGWGVVLDRSDDSSKRKEGGKPRELLRVYFSDHLSYLDAMETLSAKYNRDPDVLRCYLSLGVTEMSEELLIRGIHKLSTMLYDKSLHSRSCKKAVVAMDSCMSRSNKSGLSIIDVDSFEVFPQVIAAIHSEKEQGELIITKTSKGYHIVIPDSLAVDISDLDKQGLATVKRNALLCVDALMLNFKL